MKTLFLYIKLLLFKKKALWKQLEGYKALVIQREAELSKCQQEKTEAERVSKAVNLALSKVFYVIYNNLLKPFHLDK